MQRFVTDCLVKGRNQILTCLAGSSTLASSGIIAYPAKVTPFLIAGIIASFRITVFGLYTQFATLEWAVARPVYPGTILTDAGIGFTCAANGTFVCTFGETGLAVTLGRCDVLLGVDDQSQVALLHIYTLELVQAFCRT